MLPERFWSKVNKDGPVPVHRPDLGPCWIWTAGLSTTGYGVIDMKTADGRRRPHYAHRLAYEAEHGLIAGRLEPDHLCRVHACVNPKHLEPITHRENCIRGVQARAKK